MRYLFLIFAIWPCILYANIDNIKIADNDIGDKLAVWITKKESHNVVQGGFFSEGKWSKIVDLSSLINEGSSPAVAINNQRVGIAAWIEKEGTEYLLKTSLYDGQKWQPPVTLSYASPSSIPCVSTNIKGDACVIWNSLKRDNTIQAATYSRGKWSPPHPLSGGENVQHQHVIMSDAGIAIAIWQEYDGHNTIISSSTFTQSQWQKKQVLSKKGHNCSQPLISLNKSGNGVAVWKSPDTKGVHHFHSAQYSLTKGWGLPQDIWPRGQYPQSYARK